MGSWGAIAVWDGGSEGLGAGGEVVPEVGVYGDAEAKVFLAKVEGLFAGIADGLGGVGGGGLVEGVEDALGDVVELGPDVLAGGGEEGGIDGEEDLGLAGLEGGLERKLVGGEAAGEHGGEEVEDDGEAGAFPVADGEGALGGFDGGGVLGEVAGEVVATGDGELLAAFGVGREGAVGELGDGHVEDDVRGGAGGGRGGAGDGEDEGIVAEGR